MVSKLDYAMLSRAAYADNSAEVPKDWEIIATRENNATDFAATAFRNTKTDEIVLAYRGTDSTWKNTTDWTQNNLTIAFHHVPNQFDDALSFYNEVAGANKDKTISVTGHSLGGILAQLVGACTLKDTVTFNSIGVLHLLDDLNIPLEEGLNYSNISNYSLENDILHKVHNKMGYKFLGGAYVVPSTGEGPIDAHMNILGPAIGEAYPVEQWANDANNSAIKSIYAPFEEAEEKRMLRPQDPLLIDLDGDGIETTSTANGVYFDHGVDGFKELSAWVGEDDGILVHDKNGNGVIDDGSELFGDNYIKQDGTKAESGFDALKDFDTNGDGKLDSLDENFGAIKILKGDGSLLSLEEAGIASINLTHKNKNQTDENGNKRKTEGTYTKTDGTTGEMGDYLFDAESMNTIATEWLDVPEEIAELPDIAGLGNVYSLHQAMVRNSELKDLVALFVNSTNAGIRESLIKEILEKWSNIGEVEPNSRGGHIDAKKLGILEKFVGRGFVGMSLADKQNSPNPNGQAAKYLENAYVKLVDYVYSELESQTYMKPIYEMLEFSYDETTGKYVYDLSVVQGYIDEAIESNSTEGKELLRDFVKTFVNLGLEESSNYSDFKEHYVVKGADYELIFKTLESINIYGTETSDELEGTSASEVVFGYGGNDTIMSRMVMIQ